MTSQFYSVLRDLHIAIVDLNLEGFRRELPEDSFEMHAILESLRDGDMCRIDSANYGIIKYQLDSSHYDLVKELVLELFQTLKYSNTDCTADDAKLLCSKVADDRVFHRESNLLEWFENDPNRLYSCEEYCEETGEKFSSPWDMLRAGFFFYARGVLESIVESISIEAAKDEELVSAN